MGGLTLSIKNEMEQLVREEVERVRSAATEQRCWCSLCETDIVALALTMLPPLYCRTETFGHAAGIIKAGKIREAVQAAIKRVSLRPKHRVGAPSHRGTVSLVNYTFEVGTDMVGPALGRGASSCSCESCRSDTLAYALNRYPAKYGVTVDGRRSLHPTYLDFMRHELGMLIGQAARVVSSHPHH
ncbi:MAG TPA: late competence development ComFB family protein [bacterium]